MKVFTDALAAKKAAAIAKVAAIDAGKLAQQALTTQGAARAALKAKDILDADVTVKSTNRIWAAKNGADALLLATTILRVAIDTCPPSDTLDVALDTLQVDIAKALQTVAEALNTVAANALHAAGLTLA